MFYYLEGIVTVIDSGFVVIDAGGVGFYCFTTTNTISHLTVGEKARLYTYCSIRENAFDIFGFYDVSERRCLEQLLSVSGVGPKAALSILSVISPGDLALAVVTENEKLLTGAPGVGKKLAQRVILELKDKLAANGISAPAGTSAAPASSGSKAAEATSALAVLGYSPQEITAIFRKIDVESMTVEQIIREALKMSLK